MFWVVANKLKIFSVPVVLLFAAGFSVQYLSRMSQDGYKLFLIAPYLVSVLGIFLSIHFHRGRPFIAILLLGTFCWISRTYLSEQQIEFTLNKLYQAIILLIPFNMALVAAMKERGVFTAAARVRYSFLAVQFFIAFWFFKYNFIFSLPVLAANLGLPDMLAPNLLTQPSLLIGLFSLIVIGLFAIFRQTLIDASLFGALIAFLIAANRTNSPHIFTLFTTTGVSILTLGVIRDSYNMAFKDELTGLPSRRSLNESLNGLGSRYALAMLDVDHFKKFNDSYGHDVGDQVLKAVAHLMMGVGGGGKPFRYGGEEFTILFPGKSSKEAIPELEKVRKAIAEYKLSIRSPERPKDKNNGAKQRNNGTKSSTVSVTISIGVAERGEALPTSQYVLKAADKALYKAKNLGRNQVCLS
jgi:diguanylate cyclase (GGDEF)-like protein